MTSSGALQTVIIIVMSSSKEAILVCPDNIDCVFALRIRGCQKDGLAPAMTFSFLKLAKHRPFCLRVQSRARAWGMDRPGVVASSGHFGVQPGIVSSCIELVSWAQAVGQSKTTLVRDGAFRKECDTWKQSDAPKNIILRTGVSTEARVLLFFCARSY